MNPIKALSPARPTFSFAIALLFPVAAYAENDLPSIKAVRAAKAPAAWPLGTLLVPHQNWWATDISPADNAGLSCGEAGYTLYGFISLDRLVVGSSRQYRPGTFGCQKNLAFSWFVGICIGGSHLAGTIIFFCLVFTKALSGFHWIASEFALSSP